MALRILWEQDEALILLDALLRIVNEGYPRKQAVAEVSETLRKRAIDKGIKIDDIFRNINGIDMQLNCMIYVLTDGEKGLKCSSKVFRQAVDLYKNNRTEYEILLREAKSLGEQETTFEKSYVEWLSNKVSPQKLSHFYLLYPEIETFCLKRGILRKQLFKVIDLDVIKKVVRTVEENKLFQISHKRKVRVMSEAIRYYYQFAREYSKSAVKEQIPLEEEVTVTENIEPEITKIPETSEHLSVSEVTQLPEITKPFPKKEETPSETVKPQIPTADNTESMIVAKVDFNQKTDYTFTKPISFDYFGEKHSVDTWSKLYVEVLKCLYEDYPQVIERLKNKSIISEGNRIDFCDRTSISILRRPMEIFNNVFVEINLNVGDIVRRIKKLLDLCYVDDENLVIEYHKRRPVDIAEQTEHFFETAIEESNPEPFEIKEITYDNDEVHPLSVPLVAVYYRMKLVNFRSWSELYAEFVRYFWEERQSTLKQYIGKSLFVNEKKIDLGNLYWYAYLRNPIKIAEDVYVETDWTPQEIIDRLKKMLTLANIPLKRLTITYKQPVIQKIPEKKKTDKQPVIQKIPEKKKIDKELLERCQAVVREKFSNGLKQELWNAEGRLTISGRQFMRAYSSKYGEDFPEEANITDILKQGAFLYDGKYYVLSDEAIAYVKKLITEILLENRIIFYNVLYQRNIEKLTDFCIYSENMLKTVVMSLFPKYKQEKNFFTDSNTTLKEEIGKAFGYDICLSVEELSERLPYIDSNIIRTHLSQNPKYIRTGREQYTVIDSIDFDEEDIEKSREVIRELINEQSYCSLKDLVIAKSKELNSDIEEIILQTALFDRFFSGNEYTRKNTRISLLWQQRNIHKLLEEYCLKHEHLTLEAIENYEEKIAGSKTKKSLNVAVKTMVRVTADEFVSKNKISFDVVTTDQKIDLFHRHEVTAVSSISFNLFPYVEGYTWNTFLLVSFLQHYSQKWKFEGEHTKAGVVGVVIDAEMTYNSYNDLIMIAVADSEIELEEDEVNHYLIRNGFRQRKSEVSQIISGAYRLRQTKE